MSLTGKAFTPEEDDKLISLYAEFTAIEVARQMGRSKDSVVGRIKRLRKDSPRLLAKDNPFTDEQVRFIRQHCKTMTIEQVASYLGRSPRGVIWKARRMGFSFFKCGDLCPFIRVSDADVQLIRALRDDEQGEKITFTEIAEKFDLAPSTARWIYHKRLVAADAVSREFLL
ncbi:AsnC family protein [Salmonella enterica subsp. enterica serovar Give]|nr:AsnC family protein [Salmonella enterica subsp. enterica serovar Give]